MQITPLTLCSRRESETFREGSEVVPPPRALNIPFSNLRFYANLPGFPHHCIYIFIAVPAVSFFSLVTQTPASISQCRTRLGNKSDSHERQQHGDFGAHQLFLCKPLTHQCRADFNHCQQWARNEQLIKLPSNLGQRKVTQTCGYFEGRMMTFQFLLDHGSKLMLPIS